MKDKQDRKTLVKAGLLPDVLEIILCAVLIGEAVAMLFFSMWQTSILDICIAAFIIFKGFIFRHFSWQSVIAKQKGFDVNNIRPAKMYVMGQKIALCVWSVVSSFALFEAVRKIL